MGELAAAGVKVQLVVVGDGPARPAVEEAAAAANARAGRRVVVLAGEMVDPRPAYAAADVVLGMGGSALRGMAFGKPLVVAGVGGFWKLLTPDSAPLFLGAGLGRPGHGLRLAERRARTGWSRSCARCWTTRPAGPGSAPTAASLVTERFSLDHAAAIQEEMYAHRDATRPTARPGHELAVEAVRTGTGRMAAQGAAPLAALAGHGGIEDFNEDAPGSEGTPSFRMRRHEFGDQDSGGRVQLDTAG